VPPDILARAPLFTFYIPDFHAADLFSLPPFLRLCRTCAFLFFRCSSSCTNFYIDAFFISAYNINAHSICYAFFAAHTSGDFANACANNFWNVFNGNFLQTKTFKADFCGSQDAIEYSIRFRHSGSNRHSGFGDDRRFFCNEWFFRDRRCRYIGRDRRDRRDAHSDAAGFAGARNFGDFRRFQRDVGVCSFQRCTGIVHGTGRPRQDAVVGG